MSDIPAFPNAIDNEGGMTLRDYFAAMALSRYALEFQQNMSGEDIASQCYDLADMMMIEKRKRARND